MAYDLFTELEKRFIKKLMIIAFVVLGSVAAFSGLAQILNVYTFEGGAGLMRLITQKEATSAVNTESDLKDSLDKALGTTERNIGELPLSIEMPTLGINAKIESPTVQTVAVLDAALMKGPVYYQGSGSPGERNMLIFGHSTGFRVVRNKAYQVFNNLKTAQVGSLIYIRTSSGVHTYKTIDVRLASKYTTWIDFNSTKPLLTLATCDSFGKRTDRWVLQAEYVGFTKN